MAAFDSAIAQIDALLQRLQTDPSTTAQPSSAPLKQTGPPTVLSTQAQPADRAPRASPLASAAAAQTGPGGGSADDNAAAGKQQKKAKPAKAPKPPPAEPTTADLFSKAHIQVRKLRLPSAVACHWCSTKSLRREDRDKVRDSVLPSQGRVRCDMCI